MTKKTELKDVPTAACRLRGPFVELELAPKAEGDGKAARRRFKLKAYTGKVVHLWYWGPYVIDLKGVEAKQQLPVLMDHRADLRVGYSESVKVAGDAITAEGVFLTNENAQQILRDSDEGFPWQVSVGVDHHEVERLFLGETAEVNGQKVEGPCLIARKTTLREVSIVALGADDDTTAAAASANTGATVKVAITENEREEPMGETTIPKTTLTAAQVKEQHPTQVAELCAAAAAGAAQAAVTAERERTTAILSICHESQGKLGLQLVKDGVSTTDATAKLHADLSQKLDAAKAASLGGTQTTTALGGGNTGVDTSVDPKGELRAAFPNDERGQKAYEAYLKRQREGAAT